MDELGIAYLMFSLLIIFLVIATANSIGHGVLYAVVIVLAIIALALVVGMNWADSIIYPAFMRLLNITVEPAKGYYVSKHQDAIIKEVNGIFYATGYLTGNVFSYRFKQESIEEDEDQQMADAPERWERAIMSIKFPFKFHIISTGRDVQKVRDELEGKRSYQEYQLSRLMQSNSSNDMAIADIQRKIRTLQTQIDRIAQGEKPISSLMYIETTAAGVSSKAAIDLLDEQIRQLQVSLSILDLQMSRIVGRELYSIFKFNFAIPLSEAEIASEFDRQG
ncbi:MAG: hypothetical protein QXN59_01260 [Candidatus Micrarchaeaceae archaeon]